uniref:H(+)-exporting diphosphatase n=1 Tax=Bicosoecida sp. CB-2014 TaxID=1486930 RepID=A0A7S1GB81_9STRA|eukprot:CAMPEP_0203816664 /NCGR_PEP_ID=MMETSP0115-20131106/17351_1 /ASSEMBLY_ACC=CAM_ASM_000227 /TAXON_ID=33651 /ORGANISM="Bicosoecid sp, Strain ms1" /LENGTH=819 /DNA_ID=CAMNT_0050725571 /DNA_START=44 /DNA_END=2503 /DNA_ORIENTATION=+
MVDTVTISEALSLALVGGLVALIIAAVFISQVLGYKEGSPASQRISALVQEGAQAFLKTEYKWLTAFVLVVGIIVLLVNPNPGTDGVFTMLAFWSGAILSAAAGYGGMLIATKANTRTEAACEDSLLAGLSVAFRAGAVMALTVVGFGILGMSALTLFLWGDDNLWNTMSGFGFGASSIALFARVGGGVFTKAADVGADLVGKVEAGIPEDDPRNPATIADNVGDNVGDVAGMGADLFESYVGSLIAASTLGFNDPAFKAYTTNAIALPFWIAGLGIFCSFIGTLVVIKRPLADNADLETLLWTIRYGIIVAGILVVILAAIVCTALFETAQAWELWGCIVVGLIAGQIVGFFTEYCTSYSYRPTISIAEASTTGPATVVIQGLGVGMISVIVPTVCVGIAILACNGLAGLYGVALAAVGMLSTLAITLATDAYGPVADNAGGIAEMDTDLTDANREMVRDRTDALDALGNTTAATGKGFAIGSAVLTSVGLIAAFMDAAGLQGKAVDLREPVVLTGVLIGACLPFIFAALTMLSVGKSAQAIIQEVRRQFALAPQLLEENSKFPITVDTPNGPESLPNYQRCVSYCTDAAIQEMLVPGAMSVFAPAVVGMLLGSYGLAGMLAGSLTSGFMLALTMANAGGAWDNAKKLVEKNAADYGGKGGERHAAVVAGDTVGDPFKDTSGPALNILIKLMSIVSLVLAPTFKTMDNPEGFGEAGVVGAIIVFVVVSFVCWYFTNRFDAANKKYAAEVEKLTASAKAAAAERKAEEGAAGGDEAKGEGGDEGGDEGGAAEGEAAAEGEDAGKEAEETTSPDEVKADV